jgi:hypothetical protein
VIYAFILEHKGHCPIRLMCSTLGVSSSGFYKWTRFVPGPRTLARKALLVEIKAIHSEAKGRYGSPRVFMALRKRGRGGSLNTVAKIMRENHIRAKQARKFDNVRIYAHICRVTSVRLGVVVAANQSQGPNGGHDGKHRRGQRDGQYSERDPIR